MSDGRNLVEVEHDTAAIADAVRDQVRHGPLRRASTMFGDGTAGRQIAQKLAGGWPQVQKHLHLAIDRRLEPVSAREAT